MNEAVTHGALASAPLGLIEPHAGLLTSPPAGQLLYKIMRTEHFLASIEGSYLHFNCVGSYADFPSADPHDGQQLPGDQPGNAAARFLRSPDFNAASYYNQCRARTYACCFALANDDHLWRTYGTGGAHGKVGLVFDFALLRKLLNAQLLPGKAQLFYQGKRCEQIFSINYGIVTYVDWDRHRANEEHLPNPIQYTYLKAHKFSAERELRVSLSALGIGHFSVGGAIMEFPSSLQMVFDFRAAIALGAVREVLVGSDCDAAFVRAELVKLSIKPTSCGSQLADTGATDAAKG